MRRGPGGISFALVAAAGGGVLLGLAYPPSPLPYLATIALIPLLSAWSRSDSLRGAYLLGVLFYGSCFAVAFHWPMQHAMPSVALASIVPLVLLVLVLAVPVGLSRGIGRRYGRLGGLLAFVALHLLVEAALSRGPFALPWPLLGNALAETEPVRMLAAVGGVAMLSAWVLVSNGLLYLTVDGQARVRYGTLAALVLVGGMLGGSMMVPEAPVGVAVRAAVVQPSMDVRAWDAVDDRGRVSRLAAMTDSLYAAEGRIPDVTVWPETALPPCVGHVVCPDVADRLGAVAGPGMPPLLTGAIVADDGAWVVPGAAHGARSRTVWYNAALLLRADDDPQTYFKNRLVPFAEGVPFATRLPALAALGIDAGGVAAYWPGSERSAFEIADVRVATMICFESLFPQEARARALEGADVLVVLSQDGWWGRSVAHRQHLAFTRLRAIESGRPVVFAAATGISAVIAPDGRIGGAIPFGVASARVLEVPRWTETTPFVRLGDWIPILAGLLLALVVAPDFAAWIRRRSG